MGALCKSLQEREDGERRRKKEAAIREWDKKKEEELMVEKLAVSVGERERRSRG